MTDNGNDFTGLNYDLLVEDTLRLVVRSALKITEQSGLIGETHFYISFQTGYPGVEMDDALRAQHPETITIVIQPSSPILWLRMTGFPLPCSSAASRR